MFAKAETPSPIGITRMLGNFFLLSSVVAINNVSYLLLAVQQPSFLVTLLDAIAAFFSAFSLALASLLSLSCEVNTRALTARRSPRGHESY